MLKKKKKIHRTVRKKCLLIMVSGIREINITGEKNILCNLRGFFFIIVIYLLILCLRR